MAEAALEVNDQQGAPLPSLENLLRRTYQAIRTQDGHGQGVRLLRAGQPLNAIIAVLGPGVDLTLRCICLLALARLHEHLNGQTLPDRMLRILARAKAQAGRSHEALGAGRYAAALGAALASADLIRSLSPPFQARKAIERATRALNAAREAVGDGPDDAEKAALGKALRLRNGAIGAYEGKEFRKAWKLAGQSLALSLEVLRGRSGG